jgi:hypothetical protein
MMNKSIIDRIKSVIERKKNADEKKLTYGEKLTIALLKPNRSERRAYCQVNHVDWRDVPHMPRDRADWITKHLPVFKGDIWGEEAKRNKYAYGQRAA